MHETAQHSAVSDALTGFALGPLNSGADAALDAARARLAEARARADSGDTVASKIAALLQSQGSGPEDLRVRAWTVGATLARAGLDTDVPVVATVVTVGKAIGASDNAMAEAVAVGTEVGARLLAAVDSAEFRARWNPSSAIGLLGAVLAAARLYGLDATRARNALGVAATQAAGLARNVDDFMGALETGKAAADAIEAALIAKHGFTSAPASIDGRRGLAALMAYRFEAASIIDGIGTRWVSVSAG